MRGFPKKIATGGDLYNCLSLVQAGEIPAQELSDAIAAVEERQYIKIPVASIGDDRKTVVINACAEALAGARVKNKYTTTIREAQRGEAEAVKEAFRQIATGAVSALGDALGRTRIGGLISSIKGAGGDAQGETEADTEAAVETENQPQEMTIVTLSRALEEGETVLKILSDTSPFDVLGITEDEINSIKGVLKNYGKISD